MRWPPWTSVFAHSGFVSIIKVFIIISEKSWQKFSVLIPKGSCIFKNKMNKDLFPRLLLTMIMNTLMMLADPERANNEVHGGRYIPCMLHFLLIVALRSSITAFNIENRLNWLQWAKTIFSTKKWLNRKKKISRKKIVFFFKNIFGF